MLLWIALGTLMAGVGSVWLAAALSFGVLARHTTHMLSLAAGALLATALLNLLPEAFESGVSPDRGFMVLLGGILLFFLLDKAELWHHGHEHHDVHRGHGHHNHEGHAHHHGHAHSHEDTPRTGVWSVLAGDSLHCFGDGVLIASAFMASPALGWLASASVLVHEVPHHMGDLAVVQHNSDSRRTALIKVSLAGAVTLLGGVVGHLLVNSLQAYLPYFLVMAASSFIYVALADLIPQLQKRLSARDTVAQLLWLGAGLGAVVVIAHFAHGHAH